MSSYFYSSKEKISVILSTFNRPNALRIVIETLCRQDDGNIEIIIADDGSDESTKNVINELTKLYPKTKIKHVWQENKGFRLAKIRNLAVLKSSGEYLIFLDGDCIPPPNFIKSHRELMEQGCAVYGQRILSSATFTAIIEQDPTLLFTGKFWKFTNFLKLYITRNINRILPTIKISNGQWRKHSPRGWQNIRGCNWAMWRQDYIAINGSDETFIGWGAEDKDVAVRLINYGVCLKDGRYNSYVLHLWHPIATRESSKLNLSTVKFRESKSIIYPKKGINDSISKQIL